MKIVLDRFVDKSNTRLCSIIFFRKSCRLWDIARKKKHETAR